MYVLQWREESREDRARHAVPSPISVMCCTSPSLKRPLSLSLPHLLPFLQKWVCAGWGCAISHPLHWLTWSGGIYEKEGIPAAGWTLTVLVHLVGFMQIKWQRQGSVLQKKSLFGNLKKRKPEDNVHVIMIHAT